MSCGTRGEESETDAHLLCSRQTLGRNVKLRHVCTGIAWFFLFTIVSVVPFLKIGLIICHLAFTARTSAILCKSGLYLDLLRG